MKLFKSIETFYRNLRDSFKYSLKDLHKDLPTLISTELLIEQLLYADPNSGIKRPTINQETINEIFTTNKSIARFGDGEFIVMDGGGIPFQKANQTLTMRLREIFANKNENIIIAMPTTPYFYPNLLDIINMTNATSKNFAIYSIPKIRHIANKYINLDSMYYEVVSKYEQVGGGGIMKNG